MLTYKINPNNRCFLGQFKDSFSLGKSWSNQLEELANKYLIRLLIYLRIHFFLDLEKPGVNFFAEK